MKSAWIVAARRTPVAPRGGALARAAIHDLAMAPALACLSDAQVNPDKVDELILSNAIGAGGNPARVTALACGLPQRVGGISIDRQCCGGLDAIALGALMVEAGRASVVLAGGAESYSRRPLRYATDPDGGPPRLYEQAPFTPWRERDPDMHTAADALGKQLGINRAAQDAWAIKSHAAALVANQCGAMDAETSQLPGIALAHDAFTRSLTKRLAARAHPLVGDITPANTAVAADGAALCLIVSEDIARVATDRRVRIGAHAALGGDPELPGLAPIAAIEQVLTQERLSPADLSVAEIMEAYAVQAIACVEGAALDPAIVNPGGGALARGHPVGASGAILAVRLYHSLLVQGGVGMAAIAAAGGLGSALTLFRDR
ncbi:MAG: thiolase family protein [Pseudomonadota bacterium]